MGSPTSIVSSMVLAEPVSPVRPLSDERRYGGMEDAVLTRKSLLSFTLITALTGIAGCSTVSQRTAERRPFFQPEYQAETHGRKTLFDRVVELDPGSMKVKVAPDYQRNAPLRIAVLPFTDRGSANFSVDKIPMTFRNHEERLRWAWTDAQRLRRLMIGYLSTREFYVLNPIGIDAVLHQHGITDEKQLDQVPPATLGRWLGADAVVYGEVLNYEAYYFGLVSAWQVAVAGRFVSTHNGEQLVGYFGNRYDVDFMPAFDPTDIAINSAEALLQLRDVQLARSEEEVSREIVLRIPVSESLRLEIAQNALEMSEGEDTSKSPSSGSSGREMMTPTRSGAVEAAISYPATRAR